MLTPAYLRRYGANGSAFWKPPEGDPAVSPEPVPTPGNLAWRRPAGSSRAPPAAEDAVGEAARALPAEPTLTPGAVLTPGPAGAAAGSTPGRLSRPPQ